MQTKLIPLSDILFDPADNVRVNYPNLPFLIASIQLNGFEEKHHLTVLRTATAGKYRLAEGFTRHLAATELFTPETKIPCFIDDMTVLQRHIAHIRSNSGEPLTPYEQGVAFVRIRDEGTNAETLAKGDILRVAPRTHKEIAELVNKSGEWVRKCIGIAESPEEVRQLLIDDKVSANAVSEAQKITKDPTKLRKVLAAAMDEAGGKIATDKHVKEVREQFVELVGKTKKEKAKSRPALTQEDAERDYHNGNALDSLDDETKLKDADGRKLIAPDDLRTQPTVGSPDVLVITTDDPKLFTEDNPKKAAMVAIIEKWDEDRALMTGPEDWDDLAERLISGEVPL